MTRTSTTLVGEAVGSYEIVAREPVTDGEVVYIVIGPGAYTDVDLENFILDLYEQGIATYGAEIFNDAAAADAYLKAEAERTAEEVGSDRAAPPGEPGRWAPSSGSRARSPSRASTPSAANANRAVATSRNPPNPTMSVIVVRKIDEASAGS